MPQLWRYCEQWYYGTCKPSDQCGTLEKCEAAKQNKAQGKQFHIRVTFY
jgi:hypothetical protein